MEDAGRAERTGGTVRTSGILAVPAAGADITGTAGAAGRRPTGT
jgi:hypothetical protein